MHDFVQNYLCKHQNKCQGLHWKHEQVTLMPTVAHFICPQKECSALVTHEIVHISPDLKHDADLVKQFTTKSVNVIEISSVLIHKIVQLTDQAPSQY